MLSVLSVMPQYSLRSCRRRYAMGLVFCARNVERASPAIEGMDSTAVASNGAILTGDMVCMLSIGG